MNIDEMLAGKEINVLIAEKAMNMGGNIWRAELLKWPGRYIYKQDYYLQDEWYSKQEIGEWEYVGPDYSSDIGAAWELISKMKQLGWSFRFSNNAFADSQQAAAFYRGFRGIGEDILTGSYVYDDKTWSVADTAPLAICRAALKALEVLESVK